MKIGLKNLKNVNTKTLLIKLKCEDIYRPGKCKAYLKISD